MQVKRLKLTGFKSFVEPAELRVEPGLTGVVGPNGCGKSNVLEAIRWVMGESSPKSMRGAGMDDVIFAGTSVRPARDFAEVSLLVEHQPGDAQGDSPAPAGEIEITRRIERGAGSAYRVNGRDVRAKDVALLFADAATGAHSPALVSQGRISAIIAARPTERRLLLEEAAGISGLHVRRKDAEQKLRAAETNLSRLDDMLSEMEQRSSALRRQARSAERYRRLSDQIREAEARLVFARWREAAAAAEAAKEEAEAAAGKVEEAAEAQRSAAAWHHQASLDLATRRKASEAARERASELGHRLAALRSEQDRLRRRVAELEQFRRTLAADRAREDALRDDARRALERLESEIAAIAARLADAEQRRSTIDIRTVEQEDRAREAETALGKARAVQAAEQAEARVALQALESARHKLGRAEAEATRLSDQLGAVGAEQPLREALEAARRRRERAEKDLAAAAKKVREADAERQQAATARDMAESEAASAQAALAALESEKRSLAKALETGGGNRLISQVQAAPGFERALAAALGEDLDAELEGDGPRRWTAPGSADGDPPLAPGGASLADHVRAPAVMERRLRQIGIVDADDGTIPLAAGQRLVTMDGRLRRWDGYVAQGLGAAAAERLIRINRLAEIEAALGPAAKALEQAQQSRDSARTAMEAARAAAEQGRREENEAAGQIREAAREEDAGSVEIERLELRRAGLSERLDAARADLEEAQAALAEAERIHHGLPDAGATAARVAELRATAERAQQGLAEIRAEAATHARTVTADRQRSEAAAAEQEDWRERARAAEQRHVEFGRRIEEAEAEARRLEEAPQELDTQIEKLTLESIEAAEAARAAAAHEREAEDAVRVQERKLADAGERLSAARELRAGAAARVENHDSRRIEMGRISGEKFQCPPPLLPERLAFDAALVGEVPSESSRLERLVQDRERIGPVNLVAESELAELEQSRSASQAEREELGVAIHRLRGSIGSLNREGRIRLLAAFQEVDRHFRSLFTTLFEGGQAHLELVESDDPLEAGLEILAQPPGKKLSALTLLSGGEQALTAVALIFALFLTNPAPICVLDEVDAPLDDANVERFCDLLDRMVGETDTRYLIVTHNAVTMSRMHRLFGVTMIEKGVSRLVSVDLGGAERLLAAE